MSQPTLEERVVLLEHELTQVKTQLAEKDAPDWRSTFGAFAKDPLFDEIVRAGREWRGPRALHGVSALAETSVRRS